LADCRLVFLHPLWHEHQLCAAAPWPIIAAAALLADCKPSWRALPALLLLLLVAAGRLLIKHSKVLPFGCTVGCFAAVQLLSLVPLLA
jgi:hypothetical protein